MHSTNLTSNFITRPLHQHLEKFKPHRFHEEEFLIIPVLRHDGRYDCLIIPYDQADEVFYQRYDTYTMAEAIACAKQYLCELMAGIMALPENAGINAMHGNPDLN